MGNTYIPVADSFLYMAKPIQYCIVKKKELIKKKQKKNYSKNLGAFLVTQPVKNLPQCRIHRFNHWVGKIPWRREWQPTPVLLPEESHRQRSLEGYSRSGAMLSNLVGRMTRVATEHLKCHGRR